MDHFPGRDVGMDDDDSRASARDDDDDDDQQQLDAAAELEEDRASFELEVTNYALKSKKKSKVKKVQLQPEVWLHIRPGLQRLENGDFECVGGSSGKITKFRLSDEYAEEASLRELARQGGFDLSKYGAVGFGLLKKSLSSKIPKRVLEVDADAVLHPTVFKKQKIYVVSHGEHAVAGAVVPGTARSHDRSSSKSQTAGLEAEDRSPAAQRSAAAPQLDAAVTKVRSQQQLPGSAAAPFNVEDDDDGEDFDDDKHVRVDERAGRHFAPPKVSRAKAAEARRGAPINFGELHGLAAELRKLNRVLQAKCGGVLDTQSGLHVAGLVKEGRAPLQLLQFLTMVDGRLMVDMRLVETPAKVNQLAEIDWKKVLPPDGLSKYAERMGVGQQGFPDRMGEFARVTAEANAAALFATFGPARGAGPPLAPPPQGPAGGASQNRRLSGEVNGANLTAFANKLIGRVRMSHGSDGRSLAAAIQLALDENAVDSRWIRFFNRELKNVGAADDEDVAMNSAAELLYDAAKVAFKQ